MDKKINQVVQPNPQRARLLIECRREVLMLRALEEKQESIAIDGVRSQWFDDKVQHSPTDVVAKQVGKRQLLKQRIEGQRKRVAAMRRKAEAAANEYPVQRAMFYVLFYCDALSIDECAELCERCERTCARYKQLILDECNTHEEDDADGGVKILPAHESAEDDRTAEARGRR